METINLIDNAVSRVSQHQSLPLGLYTYELDQLTDEMINEFEVVTLDCFDTILWRKVDKPTDIFYELQHRPTFKSIGMTADQRMKSEQIARTRKWVRVKSNEVKLSDIYLAYSPSLTPESIQQLIDEEISMEIAYCYPFQPVVQVIERALKLRKRVSIVSDTYLSADMLKKLLLAHLGDNLVNQLTAIIVSSEGGVSKANGLHEISIQKHQTKKMLHIGDHPVADVSAAHSAGITPLHLMQYDINSLTLMRLKNDMLRFFDVDVCQKKPLYSPAKMLMSLKNWKQASAETWIGYASLGPLMVAFAKDIHNRVEALKQANIQPKVLFLLRDAHLPFCTYKVLYPEEACHAVRISRFSSYAASFTSTDDIENYLADVISGKRFEDMAKQLLFTSDEIKTLIKRIEKSENPSWNFIQIIRENKNKQLIVERSKSYRERLMRYLAKTAGVQSGDTLLLVDLGYSGTTQTKLSPVFKSEFNINLLGHYLLSLSVPMWRQHRSGLIDPSAMDENTLQTLVMYIALLEQLCTTTDKSVIDFDEEGNPISGEATISQDQHCVLTEIQSESIQFAKDTLNFPEMIPNDSREVLRQMALSELARLIFMPLPYELSCLNHFKFDLNLGTKDTFDVFDVKKGIQGLRERGLFFMEKNLKSLRTNYPAELRYAGITLSLTLLSQHRHGLELHLKDMTFREYTVPTILMKDNKAATQNLTALATHDGFYSLIVPAGRGDVMTGILLGKHEIIFQLLSVTLIPLEYLNHDMESLYAKTVTDSVVFEKMIKKSDNIYECESEEACLIIKPLVALENKNLVYRVIFRPLSQ